MHIIQDKNHIKLIMYNQSNALTCLKCNDKFIKFIKLNYIYVHKYI
jgi:hypothetical protein